MYLRLTSAAAVSAIMALGVMSEQARWPDGTTAIGSSEHGDAAGGNSRSYVAMNAIGALFDSTRDRMIRRMSN